MTRKSTAPRLLRSDECSRLTGLTARALRIYEERGLIFPIRDANGWRLFSEEDLARLNTIVVFKFMGFSLAQIRSSLAAGLPTLRGTLEKQADAWIFQRQRADQALKAVQGALQLVSKRQSLDVDLLCDLICRFEMPYPEPEVKKLASLTISPDEKSMWSAWWERRSEDLKQSALYLAAQRDLLQRLSKKMKSRIAPNDKSVGRIILRLEELLGRYGVRDRACRQLDWNRTLTTKWYRIGQRDSLENAQLTEADRDLYSRDLADYLESAYWHSPIGTALHENLLRAHELKNRRTPVGARAARALTKNFSETCRAWNLEDPLVHARFAAFIESLNVKTSATPWRGIAWRYLAQALRTHSAKSGQPCAS